MDWQTFKRELTAICLIIAADTRTRCFVSVFPEDPFPGDKAGISVGRSPHTETPRTVWTFQDEDENVIAINATYFEFDLYALRDSARRIDVFSILQEEVTTGFYERNPAYHNWLLRQRQREAKD